MKLFFAFVLSLLGVANGLSSADYEILRGWILDEIEAGDRIQPTFVRLAFHDCVSDTCDGCINMDTNPSNAGLQPAIDALINVKALADDAGITITWADLMALSGVVGSEYGMLGMPGNKDTVKGKNAPQFSSPFNFKTGRVDCGDAPYSTAIDNFPSPHMNHSAIMEFFALEFSFTDDEVVAIMGAHTLGRCQDVNSGYRGPWLPGKDSSTLDNTYYVQMIDTAFTYTFRNAAGPKALLDSARPQYDCLESDGTTRCGIMLNSDFEMFFDLTLDQNFQSSCEPRECPEAGTYDTAASFAASNDDFLTAYVAAFEKMIARGYAETDLTAIA